MFVKGSESFQTQAYCLFDVIKGRDNLNERLVSLVHCTMLDDSRLWSKVAMNMKWNSMPNLQLILILMWFTVNMNAIALS